jgi:diguanylate cyclase (GGDEF)-like protein
MLDLKIYLDEIINDFHKETLSNADLSLFFYDIVSSEQAMKEKMLLLLNGLFDAPGSCEKTIEDFQPIIKEIGESYYKLGTPLSTLTSGLDLIFKELSRKPMLKCADNYKSTVNGIKMLNSNAVMMQCPLGINEIFLAVRNYITEGYFMLLLKDDRKVVEALDLNYELPQNISKTPNPIKSQLQDLINMLIEGKGYKDFPSYGQCKMTALYKSPEFRMYLTDNNDIYIIEQYHFRAHRQILNLSYFMENKEYFYAYHAYVSMVKNIMILRDFVSKRVSEFHIKTMASEIDIIKNRDKLTGLYSKDRFLIELEDIIVQSDVNGAGFLIIGLNIDSFKFINDSLGYQIGNEFLLQFSNVLRYSFKQTDIISRFGKDEFFIVLSGFTDENSIILRLNNMFKLQYKQFILKEIPVPFTVSGGVYLYKSGSKMTSTDIVSRVEEIIKWAKEFGGNNIMSYSEISKHAEERNKKIELKNYLLKAIKEDRIVPVFQPIIDLRKRGINKQRNINQYEALMRIKDENGNLLLPYEYIKIAEEFSFIEDIDLIMIEKSLKLVKKGGGNTTLHLNLSGKELTSFDFVNKVEKLVKDSGIPPKNITFEITETAAINNIESAASFIETFKSKGFKFALDDFGIGFSSLFYLKKLNVDYVKIDGYFVEDINTSEDTYRLVVALNSMAKAFNIKTIAEYASSYEIIEKLKEAGVDYAQGFYIGKPDILMAKVLNI